MIKKYFNLNLIIIFLIVTWLQAADMSIQQIIDKVDMTARSENSHMLMTQVVQNAAGLKNTYTIEAFAKNGSEKQLQRYLSPSKVKGTAFLLLNDGEEIYAYFSATGRTRLIAKHSQKVMGSDFSYEDMSMTSIKKNYSHKLLGERKVNKRDCYEIELTPLKKSSYKKVTAYIDKEYFIPIIIDFYEPEQSSPVKRMTQQDIKIIDNHPTPMVIIMKNLQKGTVTGIQITRVEYDLTLDDNFFTQSALKK